MRKLHAHIHIRITVYCHSSTLHVATENLYVGRDLGTTRNLRTNLRYCGREFVKHIISYILSKNHSFATERIHVIYDFKRPDFLSIALSSYMA